MIQDGLFEDEDGAPYPQAVQEAALAVLRKLPGCADPHCHACANNRDMVADLITVVRRTSNGIQS